MNKPITLKDLITAQMERYNEAPPSEGVKYDGTKPRWSLLPNGAVNQIIEVLEFGAAKYAPDNWKKVDNGRQRYYDALMRHMEAWWNGEENDPESGLSHLAHAGCCLTFLIWIDRNEKKQQSEQSISRSGNTDDGKAVG
jgi:hypothetical protein